MYIDLNDMLYALSYALDSVEGELLGAKAYHSERVAYVAAMTGKAMGLSGTELSDLAAASVLHDNALTEYVGSERMSFEQRNMDPDTGAAKQLFQKELKANFEGHCSAGEKNVKVLPFYDRIRGAVQYHHESADGSGIYHLEPSETPLFAQLIHLADVVDNYFDLSEVNDEKHDAIHAYVEKNSGVMFDRPLVQAFHEAFPMRTDRMLYENASRHLLHDILPEHPTEYSEQEVEGIAAIFAHIVDYKSHFTCTHSIGIAEKAKLMGEYYHFDAQTQTKLYLAGALHDIGKCSISNEILEKPDKLTGEEFEIMKKHAIITWQILDRIDGFEDIRDWAALHHEKLNGQGYPFGKTAKELSFNDRLLGCVDVYQALTESRPYRDGMPHSEAVKIMRSMVSGGFIDSDITDDIDICFDSSEII